MDPQISPDALALRWLIDMGVTDMVAPEPQPWIGRPDVAAPAQAAARIAAVVPDGAPVEAADLAALYAVIESFDGCPLKRTATKTVIYDGQPASRVMVIGEAPGADEDRDGRPFVGQAGQLLDQMFAAIGRDRHADDAARAIYLTNISFWRPPGNRAPTPTEVAMCLPFVRQHIALVDPVAILAVGVSALQALAGTSDAINRSRGRVHIVQINGKDYPVVVTYRPDYLLEHPRHKYMAWDDMLMFADVLKERLP